MIIIVNNTRGVRICVQVPRHVHEQHSGHHFVVVQMSPDICVVFLQALAFHNLTQRHHSQVLRVDEPRCLLAWTTSCCTAATAAHTGGLDFGVAKGEGCLWG